MQESAYLTYQAAWKQLLALYNECSDAGWDVKSTNKWSFNEPALYDTARIQWQKWQATQPSVAANCRAFLGQKDSDSVANIFSSAQFDFKNANIGSTLAPGLLFPLAYPSSNDWWNATNFDTCTRYSRTIDHKFHSTHSDFSTYDVSASGGWGGLFSFGTHETGNDKHGNNATNTEHLNVTFCTERVDILRPWYDPTLFTYQGWSIEQIGKGQYSTGKKETANMKSDFPWTPTTFVVAKGIEICNEWSGEESSMLHHYARQENHAGLNFGLFSISAKSDTSQGTDNYQSSYDFDGSCVRVKGAQIIAWWGEINAGYNQGPMPPVSGV